MRAALFNPMATLCGRRHQHAHFADEKAEAPLKRSNTRACAFDSFPSLLSPFHFCLSYLTRKRTREVRTPNGQQSWYKLGYSMSLLAWDSPGLYSLPWLGDKLCSYFSDIILLNRGFSFDLRHCEMLVKGSLVKCFSLGIEFNSLNISA